MSRAELFAAGANPRRDWQRFLSRVEPCPTTGCWLWTSYGDKDGYGLFYAAKKMRRAHRVAYENVVGPITDGMVIDHVCRNRACVNPDHLRVVTSRENILMPNAEGLAVNYAMATRCIRGHEFTPENTKVAKDGHRGCKRCAYLRQRARFDRLTEQERVEWQ